MVSPSWAGYVIAVAAAAVVGVGGVVAVSTGGQALVSGGGGGGGGPAPVNQVAPYFCGQSGVSANVDMIGGCASATDTAVQGQTLRVGTGVWTNSPDNFAYQWRGCTTTGGQPPTTGTCADISGATSSTYTVQAGDVGKSLVPIVTALNGSTPSTPTTVAGSCNKGSTVGGDIAPESGTTTIYPDPTEPVGCSPISAVVGSTSAGMKFCTNSPVTCGFPDPLSGNVGVAHGTSLSTQANADCSSGTITGVYTTGGATMSGSCTITNSRIVGGVSLNGCTSCTVSHSDISGDYTGASAATTGTGEVANIASQCSYVWNGAAGADTAMHNTTGSASSQTTSYNYLHCSAESLNGAVGASSSYIISDECWGPCYATATTHNEAIYAYGGQAGLNLIGNTILNPWHQTAGLFTDCGWNGSPISEHVNGNLVSVHANNGALGIDNEASGCAGTSTDNQVENNRFAYAYQPDMSCGYFNGDHMTISGNLRDDTAATIATDGGC